MVYYNPHITSSSPIYHKQANQGFFHCSLGIFLDEFQSPDLLEAILHLSRRLRGAQDVVSLKHRKLPNASVHKK